MTDFYKSLDHHFPGAKNDQVFLGEATRKLNELGFTKENTLPALSICRDEILSDFRQAVALAWGDTFMLGGLAGLLVAGKTGLTAFSHHAPNESHPERFLFIVGPHIAIDENGTLCSMTRKSRSGNSVACGALVHCLNQFNENSGRYEPSLSKDDIDQYFVESSLAPHQKDIISADEPKQAMVEKALDVTLNDLETITQQISEFARASFAVLGGIFIHSPKGNHDYFAPKVSYTSDRGVKKDLNLF